MKVLVISAHTDDEILGCGGTIARLVEGGDEVFICIVCESVSARGRDDFSKMEELAKESAQILGVNDIYFLRFKDQRLDEKSLLDLNKAIEEVVQKVKPDIVFTHYIDDLNKDHRIVSESTLVATRPFSSQIKKVYQYEVVSSTELGFKEFKPNTFVNIAKTINKKIKAFSKYESEIEEYPHPRSIEGLKIKAQQNGMRSGFKYAEAFILVREKI